MLWTAPTLWWLAAGVLSEYETRQGEADEAAARSQLASISQAREKQETALALLLGRSPREVMGGTLERGSPALPAARVPEGSVPLRKVELALNVTNLTDKKGVSTLSIGSATNSYSAYPIAPRQWFLTLSAAY